ncbi:KpsF/GutQ family sugar-phosphate isomerase [Aquimarina agarivorans]|uniref:KpsF/GutQ family sugar-phosphate isomerase n=1 Tax=Aquimarina agarivorans TaxID=980584 RepID=UPI000248EC13|nr:KpsF/GutQ family sugar-phosphate isomerase [Aquimarina agarivorans]
MKKGYTHIAKQVINIEANALLGLKKTIDTSFDEAISIILNAKGKVIVTGIGKSGHIGRKIAASFASTGTPSFFLHPSEAIHGDLGMISKEDIVLAIANSGETTEIIRLIPFTKENDIPLISISSKPNSTLAQKSSVHISIGSFEEACPFNMAPTTSSLLTLAIGDAMVVSLMNGRGFNEENFAKLHPGGNIGKRLLDTVADSMKTENLPLLSENAVMTDVIYTINSGRCGLGVVGTNSCVKGIITDGDLRRAMNSSLKDFFNLTAAEVMTPNPKFISKSTKLIDAKNAMNSYKITSLLVGNEHQLDGVIQLHDINL